VGFLPGQKPSGESKSIQSCSPIAPPPCGLDAQDGTVPALNTVHGSDACGVETMRFWESEPGPVPLRPSSGCLLYGKTRLRQ